jgi:hypothetical protein
LGTVTLVVAGNVLTTELPDDGWCSCQAAHGTAFVRADDPATAEGDARWCPFAIYVDVADGDAALRAFAARLTSRRVPEGYPRTFEVRVDDVFAAGYEATNGIASLRTLSTFASWSEAQRLTAELGAKGHQQFYWVEGPAKLET